MVRLIGSLLAIISVVTQRTLERFNQQMIDITISRATHVLLLNHIW